ncbi:MAG: hypothetical protein HY393_00395 [Candidatus Diapherotrites archaeon]|nr:hypothetical protein [Candidatus Diapherotrites archaeon]
MRLVIDANVFFAALLRDSVSRWLIIDRRIRLYAPAFLKTEFMKYASELKKRSGLSDEKFTRLFYTLTKRIQFVPDESIMLYFEAAKTLINDPKDVPYVACALAVNAGLWTQYKNLKNDRVNCIGTTALYEWLYDVKS